MKLSKRRMRTSRADTRGGKAYQNRQRKRMSKRSKTKKRGRSVKKKNLPNQDDITTFSLQRIKRLEEIHEMRKQQHKIHDLIAFWIFILVIIVTNFFLSLLIIFLIVFLDDPLLYIIVIILGLAFGAMYEKLINGMSHIFLHHHVFAKIVIFICAIVGIFYIVATTSIVFNFFELENKVYSHIGISIAYFISFLVPYFFVKLFRR